MSDELDLDQFESEEPNEAPSEEPNPSTSRRRGGRPPKWPAQMTLAQQRRARKLGMTPEQVTRRLASGHPLDDLLPPRSSSPSERDPNHNPNDPTFNYSKSEVSLYIAKVVIGSQMDWDHAARTLRPGLTQWNNLQLALELENNEHVQLALSTLLKQMGIDEDSRSTFIKQIWQWFYSPNEQLALQASRILSKIFFGDKPAEQAPPALKIEGFDEGLARLQGGPEQPAPPTVGQDPEEIVMLQTDADVLMPGRHE